MTTFYLVRHASYDRLGSLPEFLGSKYRDSEDR